MEISRGAIGIVAATCVAVGAGGAYFASRTSEPALVAAAESGPNSTLLSSDPMASPVEPSEAIVSEAPVPAPAPAAASRNRPSAPVQSTIRPRRQPDAGGGSGAASSSDSSSTAAMFEKEEIVPPALEPSRVFEPVAPEPVPRYEELVVPAQSVIGLQIESPVTSENARVEDEVVARVTRDVRVGDRVAIPAGSRAHGEVTLVERGGRLRERARLGVRFTSILLADGTTLPIETETVFREGDAPGGASAAKIGGGAIGGAIIGGIFGGAKGAAIGGSVGAGAGSAAVLAGGRNPATLPSGSPVTVRTEEPVAVTVER